VQPPLRAHRGAVDEAGVRFHPRRRDELRADAATPQPEAGPTGRTEAVACEEQVVCRCSRGLGRIDQSLGLVIEGFDRSSQGFDAHVLKVLNASPGDTSRERDAIEKGLHGWNSARAEREQIPLAPWGWETHAIPELGGTAQDIIDRQAVEHALDQTLPDRDARTMKTSLAPTRKNRGIRSCGSAWPRVRTSTYRVSPRLAWAPPG
jgi:hypothetical protein